MNRGPNQHRPWGQWERRGVSVNSLRAEGLSCPPWAQIKDTIQRKEFMIVNIDKILHRCYIFHDATHLEMHLTQFHRCLQGRKGCLLLSLSCMLQFCTLFYITNFSILCNLSKYNHYS